MIYVRILPRQVFIAADSKRTIFNLDGSISLVTGCKIVQAGDAFFVSAGLGGYGAIGFDIRQTARQALTSGGTLLESVKTFQQLVGAPLTRALEAMKRVNRRQYDDYLRGAALQTVFVKIENKSPIVVASFIRTREATDGAIQLQLILYKCPGDCVLPTTIPIGESQRADEMTNARFWKRGSIVGIRELMEVSIADKQGDSGGPIDILRITKNGATWIQRKKECPDIENALKPKPRQDRRKRSRQR